VTLSHIPSCVVKEKKKKRKRKRNNDLAVLPSHDKMLLSTANLLAV